MLTSSQAWPFFFKMAIQDLGPYPYQLILGTNIGFMVLEALCRITQRAMVTVTPSPCLWQNMNFGSYLLS